MAKIEFLGGEETGDVARVKWGKYTFVINQPLECDDPHIVAKAKTNRFFRVDDPDEPIPADRMAKARAALAAKRDAAKTEAAAA